MPKGFYDRKKSGRKTVSKQKPTKRTKSATGYENIRDPIPEQIKQHWNSYIDPTGNLLAARGTTHGDFTLHAEYTQALKRCMHASINWSGLSPVQVEALEMIQHKIGRILAGNPNHADHWDGIAGYAKLASERVAKS